jgi:vacuolar-type H+-ATPase subunit I/STV1
VGHGTLLTLFAVFMIVNEKKYLKQQENGTINGVRACRSHTL